MKFIENKDLNQDSVNYEEAAIAELELGGLDYRLDADQGSSVAISSRPSGTWRWSLLAEGRWDGSRLRAKGLEFDLTTALGRALGEAMRQREE